MYTEKKNRCHFVGIDHGMFYNMDSVLPKNEQGRIQWSERCCTSFLESIIAGLVILITKREIMGLAVCIVLYMLECSRHIQYSALRYFLNFVSRVLFDFHSYN